jgi:phosphatidate cytidylyltransferase
MVEKSGEKVYKIPGILAALIIPNLLYFGVERVSEINILVFFTMGIMVYRVLKNQVENSSKEIGLTLLGIVYVSVFFSQMLLISKLPKGGAWIFSLQILVWVCDSFAYFVGVKFGRKFIKRGVSEISPKKSVEGSIGGIIFTIIAMYIINYKNQFFVGDMAWMKIVGFAIMISLAVQIGDLAESMFKREFKIKDSGRILGEHGGILDRFDSFIFVLPVAYFLLTV